MSRILCGVTGAVAICILAGCKQSGSGPATPVLDTQYFTSSAMLEINNDVPGKSTIQVSDFSGTITNLEISVNIQSLTGSVCQWGLSVRHPDGTGVALMSPDNPSCHTALVTTFPTQTQPLRSLNVFNGKPAEGQWELSFSIEDGGAHPAVTNRIRLNSWTLTITNQR